jgi:uncharacterized membrane protein (DUF485 family)
VLLLSFDPQWFGERLPGDAGVTLGLPFLCSSFFFSCLSLSFVPGLA